MSRRGAHLARGPAHRCHAHAHLPVPCRGAVHVAGDLARRRHPAARRRRRSTSRSGRCSRSWRRSRGSPRPRHCSPTESTRSGSISPRLPGGLPGQALHLGRDHREAFAVLAGARRLDRGVEGQQIGLAGDGLDQRHHLADLLRGGGETVHRLVGAPRLFDRALRDGRRTCHLAADLGDRCGQFLGRRGDRSGRWRWSRLATARTAELRSAVSPARADIDRDGIIEFDCGGGEGGKDRAPPRARTP